ncbi:hypothetical protein WJX82_005974 [Trebouxia sp. C0006]
MDKDVVEQCNVHGPEVESDVTQQDLLAAMAYKFQLELALCCSLELMLASLHPQPVACKIVEQGGLPMLTASVLERPNFKEGVTGSMSCSADWIGNGSEDDLTQLSYLKSIIDMAVKITICNPKRHAAVDPAKWQADIGVVLIRMSQAIILLEGLAHLERSSQMACTVSYGDNNDLQVDLENSSLQWGAKQCNVGVLWRYVCALAGQKQFSAAATAVHLCLVEIHLQSSMPQPHAKTGSYCKAVVAADILDDVFKAVLTGLKEPLPWSTEHCVALTRVLEMCSQVCRAHDATMRTATHVSAQRAGVLPVIQQRLQSLQKTIPIQRLQQQFLTATLGLLAPSCDPLLTGPRLEGLPQVLIDLLVSLVPSEYTGQDPVAPTCRGYVEIGLAKLRGIQLQCKTLGAVMQLLEQPKDFQYLGQHAIPDCLPPFLKFVELDMKRFDERRQPNFIDDIIDLSPYLDMLGAYSKTTGKKKVKGVPPGAAKALLQLLFLLVQRLESWTHEGPARKQPFQMKLMASHRLYLDTLLSVLKVMRTQQLWMSAWAALAPWGWCKEKTAQFMLKRWLRRLQAEGVVTELATSDIQECFTIPQDMTLAEATASQAAARLLAEEQQAAARVAAKKADHSVLADVSASGSVELPDDTADTVGAVRDQTSDADFLRSLFCCPITHSMMVDPVVAADGRTYERLCCGVMIRQSEDRFCLATTGCAKVRAVTANHDSRMLAVAIAVA